MIDNDKKIEIISTLLNKTFDGSPIKYGRRIDVVIGPPASGKSSAISEPLSKKYGSVIIDCDMVKKYLPTPSDETESYEVHNISKIIANVALKKAFSTGMNIVLPIVGKDFERLISISEAAKANGYSPSLHLNVLSLEKILSRNKTREINTGRFVPMDYIMSIGNTPYENFEKIKEMNMYDSYYKYSNDVPIGEPPILLEEKITEKTLSEKMNNLKDKSKSLEITNLNSKVNKNYNYER